MCKVASGTGFGDDEAEEVVVEVLDRAGAVVVVCVTGIVVVALLLAMLGAPWAGPVLLTLVPDHGLEAADLVVVVVAAAALETVRRFMRTTAGVVVGDLSSWMRVAVVVAAGAIAIEGSLSLADVDRRVPLVPYAVLVVFVGATLAAVGCWLARPIRTGSVVGRGGARGVGLIAAIVAALAAGTVVDLVVLPTGTLFGVSAVAVVLATSGGRVPAVAWRWRCWP